MEGAVGWLSVGRPQVECVSQSEKGNRRRYRFLPLSGFITIRRKVQR